MLKKLYISDGKLVESDDNDASVFIYTAPEEKELKYLVGQFRIDEHTLSSSLGPDELSRLEFEPEHVAIIFKRPKRYCKEDNFLFKVASTGIFFFTDRLEGTPKYQPSSEAAPYSPNTPHCPDKSISTYYSKLCVHQAIYSLPRIPLPWL